MGAVSRLTVTATGAATTILIARLLGPDGSGGYYIAQSVLLLLTVLTTLGVEHGIAYYVSSGAWAARPAYVAALRAAAVVGTVGALAGITARLLVPEAFGHLSLWMTVVTCAALPFGLAWFYLTFVALAVDRYEAFVVPPAALSALTMVLAGAGAIAFGLGGAVAGAAVATVAIGACAVLWGLRRLAPPAGAEPPGQLRRAIGFGIKGYAANALQLINYRIDVFILSAAASSAEVGQYAIAATIAALLWLLPQAVADVLFPRVAHLSATSDGDAHRELVETKGARHVVLVVIAGAVGLVGVLQLLLVPIYGQEFEPSVELGLILLPGVALIGVGGVLSATIVGRGKPIYSLFVVLITTPVTIALYVWLIPELGARGAALASTISYTCNFLLTCYYYRRVTGRPVWRLLRPTRAELRDLRELPRAISSWARGMRP